MKSALVLFALFANGLWAAPLEIAPHVVNGQALRVQHAVAVFAIINANNEGHFGGGSIISNRHIITGANLIFGSTSCRVGYGGSRLGDLTMVLATTMSLHPLFNRITLDNDIAIIFLPLIDSIPEWTDDVRPIALPTAPAGTPTGSLAGYGFTSSNADSFSETLFVAGLIGTDIATCTDRFPRIPFTTQFCAIGRSNELMPALISNICSGDNGAGFYTGEGYITTTTTTEPPEPPEDPEDPEPEDPEDPEPEDPEPEDPEDPEPPILVLSDEGDENDEAATPNEQEEPVLIGVASVIGNFWECNPEDPRGYTDVFTYVNWIRDLTGIAE